MIFEVYAVHDAAVGAFNTPLFFRSRGEAVRAFQNACGHEAGFKEHAKDYSFWLLGSFDDSNGALLRVDPDRVCSAVDFQV